MRIAICLSIMAVLQCQGCSSSSNNSDIESSTKDLHAAILGQWVNLSMEIKLGRIDSVISVPEGQWETILQMKPIVTDFKSNGSYESKYTSLADTILFTDSGKWEMKQDSLYMTSGGNTTSYKFEYTNHVGTFTGYLDWDNDNLNNDLYIGRQKKH